jgi:hypothetical protein
MVVFANKKKWAYGLLKFYLISVLPLQNRANLDSYETIK